MANYPTWNQMDKPGWYYTDECEKKHFIPIKLGLVLTKCTQSLCRLPFDITNLKKEDTDEKGRPRCMTCLYKFEKVKKLLGEFLS